MAQQREILIVGGGTAGWLTAAYLAKFLDIAHRPDVAITLVEAPEIGIIGVGEGAFPTMRTTLEFLGIDEYAFVRETSATFKQGIRFDDWLHAPQDGVRHGFVHPFAPPLYAADASLVSLWLAQEPHARAPFAEAVTIQHRVAAAGRAPKRFEDGAFAAPLSYAYHFDAVAFARVLRTRALALGVAHIEDRVREVALAGDGTIAHVDFERSGAMRADLFVDCTGLRAELLGAALAEPFVSVRDRLFTDSALAIRVPRDDAAAPLASHTVARAQDTGWIWDIGLRHARGIGSVFSSAHGDEAAARAGLARYIGDPGAAERARLIRFEPGYRRRQWVGNCVATGMAAGFLEPLEATGIVLIEVAAAMIAEMLPLSGPAAAPAARFSAAMAARFESIVAFLKLHYCLSRREEPFWRDNRAPETIPASLRALIEQWRHRPPSRFDFRLDEEVFAFFSYQYVLYGMGFEPAARPSPAPRDRAILARIADYGAQAIRDLPGHRELIEQINRFA